MLVRKGSACDNGDGHIFGHTVSNEFSANDIKPGHTHIKYQGLIGVDERWPIKIDTVVTQMSGGKRH